MVSYHFPGKVVLVTGSSRGMGAVTLEAFAASGAVCVLNFYPDPDGVNAKDADDTAARLRTRGATVLVLPFDVSNYAEVETAMKRIKDEWGGLDILVNNAGVLRDRTIRKMTPVEWHTVMTTNLDGVFHACKHGADIMRDGGRVINVASIAGMFPFHGQANYAAAKAGVIALTKVMAKEVARRGITVNAVAPGVIRTAMLDGMKPEVLADYEKQIPVGRIGRPEDVAHAILFLACEESSYITGQVLPITGGWF
ncbi:MAG: SDR family oxidoreductase [Planctomycetia bacterium]|nr:SDR family oxidoreductase [Planctomycetia bacterium]